MTVERPVWIGVAACLGATVAALATLSVSNRRRTSSPYPPGPRPKWIIGNILDMPLSSPWLRFSEWGAKYGEITYATIFTRRIVVLNSLDACKEVMEVQGASASGRPWTIMHDLMGMLKGITGVQETPMWRYERRLTNSALGPHVVKQYYSVQQFHAACFVKTMLENPTADCGKELRYALGKSIFAVTYGLPPEIHFDEFMRINDILIDAFLVATVPGRFLVESFPFLRYVPSWFPGAGFMRYAELVADVVEKHASTYFNAVKNEIRTGAAPPSFVANCLEAQATGELSSSLESKSDEEEALKWAASEMYRAGTHTTVQTAVKFVTAMQLFPDVQMRAQEEILRVVGSERLPTIEDRDDLPYVNAVISEALRWHPAVALGVPHRITKDIVYKGYCIPKDTTVIGNQWNLSLFAQNGSRLDRPDDFEPERFLVGDAKQRPHDPNDYVFGFGRRLCPGRHLAANILFLTVSSILATVWISKEVDESGIEVPLVLEWSGEDAISFPHPFRPRFRPRSSMAVQLINAAADAGPNDVQYPLQSAHLKIHANLEVIQIFPCPSRFLRVHPEF